MGKTLTEIAQQLKDANKKVQLIYAFNGSGKTRLSREFKQLIAPKNDNGEEAEQAELSRTKILYYNAFTEDLFYWDNDPRCELGYALLPKYWGKGFGTELSKGILKYAREQNKLNELVATVHRKNKASIKILKCCGFQFKRVVRKHGRQKDLYVNNA